MEASKYLKSLKTPGSSSKYSDDGFTLSAPNRYSSDDWWRHLLSFRKCEILRRVKSHLWFNFFFSSIVSAIAIFAPNSIPIKVPNLNVAFQMSGGILGILLAFRTGQSYDRFWQGRAVWGNVVNNCRSFYRSVLYVDNPKYLEAAVVQRWVEAFPVCLMQHLRGERDVGVLAMLNDDEKDLVDGFDNMPMAVIMALTQLLNRYKSEHNEQPVKELVWFRLELMLTELLDAVGQAEKIAGTPVPVAYSRHNSRLLSIWTFCMPFVLVANLPPLLVPVVTTIVSWTLFATEEIGHVIEEPFGLHDDRPNILPLHRYCKVIADDIASISAAAGGFEDYVDNLEMGKESTTYLYVPPPTNESNKKFEQEIKHT